MSEEELANAMHFFPSRSKCADIKAYLLDGVNPGSFLTAVITNNLRLAVSNGSPADRMILTQLVDWLSIWMPRESWGTKELCDRWTRVGGLNGLAAQEENRSTPKESATCDQSSLL